MEDLVEPKESRARAAGRLLLRVVLPLHAMRTTVSLAKRDAMRSKANLALIAELGAQARRSLTGREPPPTITALDEHDRVQLIEVAAADRNDSFESAIARRGPDAPSIAELRKRFLLKKRTAIAADVFFSSLAMIQVVHVILVGGTHMSIALAILSLVGCQPICFVNALAAQLRIWQLETRRLSRAEHGGLGDFMSENPRWWLDAINPELSRHAQEAA